MQVVWLGIAHFVLAIAFFNRKLLIERENRERIQLATSGIKRSAYDSLNRLKSAREVISAVEQWKQQFTYDCVLLVRQNFHRHNPGLLLFPK